MFHALYNSIRRLFISAPQLQQQKEIQKYDNNELERQLETKLKTDKQKEIQKYDNNKLERQLAKKFKTDKRKEAFRNAILKKPKHLRNTAKYDILEKQKIKQQKDKENQKKQADENKQKKMLSVVYYGISIPR